MQSFFALVKRELTIAYRDPISIINFLIINFININLFPFAFDPNIYQKNNLFAGTIIISMVFSLNMSSDLLFDEDNKDGTLNQMIIANISPYSIILSKIMSYWMATYLPNIIIYPIIAMIYNVDIDILKMILFLGIINFLFVVITCFSSLLTLNIKKNIIVKAMISFPLSISVIIISTLAISNINYNDSNIDYLSLIGAIIMIFLPITIFTSRFII